MERPSLKRILLECLTLLFLLHTAVFILSDNQLFDPDTFTHMARLRNILAEGSLHATFLGQLNAPYGMDLHWTLPFDLFCLIVISPFAIFLGWQKALAAYAGWVTPVSHLMAVLSILWALLPLMRRLVLRMTVYGALFGGYIFSYGIFGRVDHHIFMLAFWSLWIGAVIRFVVRGYRMRNGILGGFFAAVCLWISPETYPGVVWGMTVMIAAWSLRPGRCDRAAAAFAVSFPLFSLAALFLDPPRFGFFSINYYRFSIHTVVLAGFMGMAWLAGLAFFRKNQNKAVRLAGLAGIHGIVTLGYWLLYPQVLNPGGSLRAAEVLSHCVKEYEGVFMYSVSYSIFSAGRGLMGLAAAFVLMVKDRKRPWNLFLGLFVLLITFYTLLAFKHRRFGIYTDVLAMVPLAILGVRAMRHLYKTRLKSAAYLSTGIFLLALFAPQLGGFLAFGAEKIFIREKPEMRYGLPAGSDPALKESLKKQLAGREKSCKLADITPVLNDPAGLGKGVFIIAADLSWSPELMYLTPHRYISGPYGHFDALNDVIQFMYTGSVSGAREIAKARKVDYVLICPYAYGWYRPPQPDSLFAAVVNGEKVDWLEEVPWPSSVKTDFRLWRVRK